MRNPFTAALALLVLTVAACGGEADVVVHDDDTTETDPSETPIADDMKKPLDKAAAVEDVAMERKAEMDRRLAEMEGESDADDDGDP